MAKKIKVKASKPVEVKNRIIKTGYDPRNRPVHVSERRTGKAFQFRVSKPDTGFVSKPFKKLADCVPYFEHQVSCSQN